MKDDIIVQEGVIIPEHELEITASRSGGAGGQHVNRTDSKITIRWNVKNTRILTDEQKERVVQKLQHRLTLEGDLIINNSESRSQQHNKKMALVQLAKEVRKALHIPKKRMKTKISAAAQEARLHEKSHRSEIKHMRRKIDYQE